MRNTNLPEPKRLSEDSYVPDYKMPLHAHEQPFLYFVLSGSFTEVCRNTARLVESSTLIFHPAGEPHANHFHDAPRVVRIAPDPMAFGLLACGSSRLDTPIYLPAERVIRLVRAFHQDYADGVLPNLLSLEALVLEVFAEAIGYQEEADLGGPPRWLRQSRDFLHDQFAEDLTLGEVADRAGVHPVHLARAFRRYYFCSVGAYVRNLRIDRARRLLLASDVPLVEVALAAGFADQSHLTKVLKQTVGLTPAEFRRQCRR